MIRNCVLCALTPVTSDGDSWHDQALGGRPPAGPVSPSPARADSEGPEIEMSESVQTRNRRLQKMKNLLKEGDYFSMVRGYCIATLFFHFLLVAVRELSIFIILHI
jgi:hypothetical protein